MCFFENDSFVYCAGSEKAKGGHDSLVWEHTQAHGQGFGITVDKGKSDEFVVSYFSVLDSQWQ